MNSVNWKNDEDVDKFIRAGLLYANKPVDTTIGTFDYSQGYKNWEHKLLVNPFKFIKKTSRTAFRRILNVAAAVFITITVIFGTLMAASPRVRAAVINWFKETFSTHDAYQFTQTSDEQFLGHWRPTYLPDGYVETFCIDIAGQTVVDFDNDSGDRITLSYTLMNMGGTFRVDSEDMDIIETAVGGHPASIYKTQDSAKTNAIVWVNENLGVAFRLRAFAPYETLLRIAESVELSE